MNVVTLCRMSTFDTLPQALHFRDMFSFFILT